MQLKKLLVSADVAPDLAKPELYWCLQIRCAICESHSAPRTRQQDAANVRIYSTVDLKWALFKSAVE